MNASIFLESGLRASRSRAAALPVGAASAMRVLGRSLSMHSINCAAVRVLPVPGPPLMKVIGLNSACATAMRCQSGAAPDPVGLAEPKSASRHSRNRALSRI